MRLPAEGEIWRYHRAGGNYDLYHIDRIFEEDGEKRAAIRDTKSDFTVSYYNYEFFSWEPEEGVSYWTLEVGSLVEQKEEPIAEPEAESEKGTIEI